jgi:glycosyltransferase involved in cell wall biosynthesis
MNLSLIVPVYNEEETLPLLYEAIKSALSQLDIPWELILVDDGSSDKSPNILEELAELDPEHIRGIALRRNFGQTAAIAAGIDHANGSIIILMDADMQNDPADIPLILEKLEQGYDLVSGWRAKRQDTYITRTLPSNIANLLISWVTGVRLHDYGCTLKAYRRETLSGFRLYGEMHRFIPVYAASVGAHITEVKVRHHPRRYGKAKYGLERTLKVILDLVTVKFLTSYANKPIYLFGGAGILLIAISAALLLYLFFRRIGFGISPFDSPLFPTGTMVAIMGFQSIMMGLIAELLVRTYHESQNKPTYTIRKAFNFDANFRDDL